MSALVLPGPASADERQLQGVLPLREAVAQLTVADENREGYERDKFKHWIDADGDGCSTRAEVLLEEAVEAPEITGRCTITGGLWYSFYDDTYVDNPRSLDIDHMVPLAEAWDSGTYDWSPERRRDYANNLDEAVALWAVTGRSNRSKADRDVREWLPPHEPAVCSYITAWGTVKTRWGLTVDQAEQEMLTARAADCPNVPITTQPVA
ncbi:HNH endonuclease family protein [Actinosynnema sp. NPDC002837]